MEIQTVIQGLASGLLTGGAAAGTSLLSVFKGIRKRLHDLEEVIGEKESEPPTGIFYTLDTLTKAVRSLRSEINSWRDEPPDWLSRMVARASRGSMSTEVIGEFEQRIESKLNSFKNSLQRLEDDLDRREQRLEDAIGKSSPEFNTTIIFREEYDRDSKSRAEEMVKVRESIKASNAFLRGIMTAMGYVDAKVPEAPSTPPPPPLVPPRPALRMPPTPGRAFPLPPLPKSGKK